MSNGKGKFTAEEYRRMEKFLGCDDESIKQRRLKQMQERKKKNDYDYDVAELLEPWKSFFNKDK